MMPVTRSKPMPVSTCFAGRGEKVRAAEILAAHLLQAVEDWAEDVGLVVRNLCGGEIFETFRALDDAGDALEAHAGVHMLRGQRREGACCRNSCRSPPPGCRRLGGRCRSRSSKSLRWRNL